MTSRWRARALLVTCLFLGVGATFAVESETGFRVVQDRQQDGVTLIVQSDYCVEYTVTLEATLRNMTSSRPLPFTVDAAGRRTFVLARFKPTDKTRPWHYDYNFRWQYGARRNSTDNDADYAMPFGPGRYVVHKDRAALTVTSPVLGARMPSTGMYLKAPSFARRAKAASSVCATTPR
jgi:hypothetical protein